MPEEVKIRVGDPEEADEKLRSLGAEFVQEVHSLDTYFQESPGELLKVVEDERGAFLVHMRVEDGKFRILKNEKISTPEEMKKELEDIYGLKKRMKKIRRIYEFRDYEITLDLAENVGAFLVIEGEDLDRDRVARDLDIDDPEFVATPLADYEE